jgi:transposase
MKTIGVWVKIYLSGGIGALTDLNYENQGPQSKLAEYEEEIDKLTDEEQIPTMTCLQQRIKELYGVEVEESWLFRWCKKKSICLLKRPD